MRSELLSFAACGSHMERLHASELLRTSQGAPSWPSTSQLNVIPFAFTRIGSSSSTGALRRGSGGGGEKTLEQGEQRPGRLCRHHVHGIDQLEARAGNVSGHLLTAGRWPHLVEAPGHDHG